MQVLDRLLLSQLLDQLQHVQLPNGVTARGPRYVTLTDFGQEAANSALEAAGMIRVAHHCSLLLRSLFFVLYRTTCTTTRGIPPPAAHISVS